jgi:hypothetical protein
MDGEQKCGRSLDYERKPEKEPSIKSRFGLGQGMDREIRASLTERPGSICSVANCDYAILNRNER